MHMEHYCTLFDRKFLPAGLCLHESLARLGEEFHLWILCMDEEVEEKLRALKLENITLIRLDEIENERLKGVKGGRSTGEYCWTLTPFLPGYVLERNPALKRVTYLDADIYFFRSTAPIFRELEQSGAEVLITEHAYAPEYDKASTAGRFCVQFVTFANSAGAKGVLQWWQDRCIEWCFARVEDGKFGDQKYLDQWPALFGGKVHILQDKRLALAPWNADFYLSAEKSALLPVFYHFHGLRLIAPTQARLYSGYQVGDAALDLYQAYVQALERATARLEGAGYPIPFFAENLTVSGALRAWLRALLGKTKVATLAR